MSAEDTAKHKPHPDPYLRTLELLGALPSEALAPEDSENGVRSALAAKLQVAGIMIGNHGAQDLRKAGLSRNHMFGTLDEFISEGLLMP